MNFDTIIKQLTRVPAMIVAPLMGIYITFKRYLNPRSLLGKVSSVISRIFKKVFSFRPEKMEDYYKIGHVYVF